MLDPRTAQLIRNITQSLGSGVDPRIIVIRSSAALQTQGRLTTLTIFFIVMIAVLLLLLLALGAVFLLLLQRSKPEPAHGGASGYIPEDSPRSNPPTLDTRPLEARTRECQRPAPTDPRLDSARAEARLGQPRAQVPLVFIAPDARPPRAGLLEATACAPECPSPTSTRHSNAQTLAAGREARVLDLPRCSPQPVVSDARPRAQSSD